MKLEQKKYSVTFETTGHYSIEVVTDTPENAVEIASGISWKDIPQEERNPEEIMAISVWDEGAFEEVWTLQEGEE